jgi:hypothetical protein
MHPILAAEAVTEHTLQRPENRRALRQLARRVEISGTTLGETKFQATLQDLSRRGLRVRSQTNVPCGETVTINGESGADLAPLVCRIVRVQVIHVDGRELFEYGLHIAQASRDQGHRWFIYFCYGGLTMYPPPQV